MLVQLFISNLLVNRGVIAFPDDGNLITTGFEVTINAICADVKLTIFVPFDGYIRVRVGGVLDF